MLRETSCETAGLLTVSLDGIVTSRDQEQIVAFVRASLATAGSVRVLLQLENFGGWLPDPAADPDAVWLRDDEGVTAIAIVGAPDRRIELQTLFAQPLRRLPVAYFTEASEARDWLARAATPGRSAPSD
jgi:hypothetical protein